MAMHTLMTLEFYQRNPCARGAKRELQISKNRTYNTGDSLVVTDPTTSPAISGLSSRERTGSSVFLGVSLMSKKDAKYGTSKIGGTVTSRKRDAKDATY